MPDLTLSISLRSPFSKVVTLAIVGALAFLVGVGATLAALSFNHMLNPSKSPYPYPVESLQPYVPIVDEDSMITKRLEISPRYHF